MWHFFRLQMPDDAFHCTNGEGLGPSWAEALAAGGSNGPASLLESAASSSGAAIGKWQQCLYPSAKTGWLPRYAAMIQAIGVKHGGGRV
jgi:hypothetical protein